MTDLVQMTGSLTYRASNQKAANCSECKIFVEVGKGYLFKNTKFRNSKGYHVKCHDCYTGLTAKRIKAEEKALRGKSFSVTTAKKIYKEFQFRVIAEDDQEIYCEVIFKDEVVLGWSMVFHGGQEYPDYDFCQQIASKLGGTFTDNATEYIMNQLTTDIQNRID